MSSTIRYQLLLFCLKRKIDIDVILESYWDLYQWSIDNIDKFWEEFWIYSHIKYSVPYEQVF